MNRALASFVGVIEAEMPVVLAVSHFVAFSSLGPSSPEYHPQDICLHLQVLAFIRPPSKAATNWVLRW